jgi:fimbrial chaperone protein
MRTDVRRIPTLPTAAFLALAALALGAQPAAAQGFAALVSPPRFELSAKPGASLRSVLEVSNRAAAPAHYRIHSADFDLTAQFGVVFHDALQPGSCRPWVALERPEATLPGGGTMRYRFEITVPKDAPSGECRFAILIEGADASVAQAGGVQLPIAGRIGVIVYLAIGDAAPKLEVFGPHIVTLNGKRVPTLRVHNAGNAHGRVSGFLTGKDATGARFDFTPSDFPILPQEEREVYFLPSLPGNDSPSLTFPVSVRGTLEWTGGTLAVNERFE